MIEIICPFCKKILQMYKTNDFDDCYQCSCDSLSMNFSAKVVDSEIVELELFLDLNKDLLYYHYRDDNWYIAMISFRGPDHSKTLMEGDIFLSPEEALNILKRNAKLTAFI